jgi:hypothetical protein
MKIDGIKVFRLKAPRLNLPTGDRLASTAEVKDEIMTKDAMAFLKEALKDGPAEKQGLTRMAVFMASKMLQIKRESADGVWLWSLLAPNAEPSRAIPPPPCPSPPPAIPPPPREPSPIDSLTEQDDGSWTHAMPEVVQRQKTDPHWYTQDQCLYRGKLYGVQIDADAVVDQEELNIIVKHSVLSREQKFKRLRREIETFENLGRVRYRNE